ncbi:histidine phosphatase family protein [Bacillus pseudomycoides]|uniref:Histidine phosphatase family protein n=1 Tax=Bacillus pseudomycoides TaxID=64104 RepID=A0AA91V8N0_9BACI|nr:MULTISPECIES: histidine phosphatase family protein [Bacillus]PEB51247.1 histidine phosphatase family protein [Bacillus sp. AFS098217]PED80610.1 histidine phosphatase family protein [Bacillus pseudomycoides]PEU17237.1 histidine phosphatase family protein [Bacillus sp. AFS014408]PEU17405.1 histidine phosphatase family protein [Bacillus sp. AFS019443]PFW63896.1 histidine phosphatase family protein [Bacillus sp. AFS075034]
MKKLIVMRHCSATGQERDAALTIAGEKQASVLAEFLIDNNLQIDSIISSPFVRAIQSIAPFSLQANLSIREDERLTERILSNAPMEDWLQKLEYTFTNIDIAFSGGESTKQAMNRVTSLIQNVLEQEHQVTLLVTHGNLLALILKYFDDRIGFQEWKSLSNPDVYEITIAEQVTIHRLWGNTVENSHTR